MNFNLSVLFASLILYLLYFLWKRIKQDLRFYDEIVPKEWKHEFSDTISSQDYTFNIAEIWDFHAYFDLVNYFLAIHATLQKMQQLSILNFERNVAYYSHLVKPSQIENNFNVPLQ